MFGGKLKETTGGQSNDEPRACCDTLKCFKIVTFGIKQKNQNRNYANDNNEMFKDV